jgi:hypothetical protein
VLNPLSWATMEMGLGARHDALEDKVDHHNQEKNMSQGTLQLVGGECVN